MGGGDATIVGVGAEVGVGVGVGVGMGIEVGTGGGVADGASVAVGCEVAVGAGVSVGGGMAVAVDVGSGFACAVGVKVAVGSGAGDSVAEGLGGVNVGVGEASTTASGPGKSFRSAAADTVSAVSAVVSPSLGPGPQAAKNIIAAPPSKTPTFSVVENRMEPSLRCVGEEPA